MKQTLEDKKCELRTGSLMYLEVDSLPVPVRAPVPVPVGLSVQVSLRTVLNLRYNYGFL